MIILYRKVYTILCMFAHTCIFDIVILYMSILFQVIILLLYYITILLVTILIILMVMVLLYSGRSNFVQIGVQFRLDW